MSQFMPEIASAHLQPGAQARPTLEGRVWDTAEPSRSLSEGWERGRWENVNKKGPYTPQKVAF